MTRIDSSHAACVRIAHFRRKTRAFQRSTDHIDSLIKQDVSLGSRFIFSCGPRDRVRFLRKLGSSHHLTLSGPIVNFKRKETHAYYWQEIYVVLSSRITVNFLKHEPIHLRWLAPLLKLQLRINVICVKRIRDNRSSIWTTEFLIIYHYVLYVCYLPTIKIRVVYIHK